PTSEMSESLILLYPPRGNPYLKQVKLRLQKRKSLNVVDADSPKHILEQIQSAGSAVLFICIRDFAELKLALKCLVKLKDSIRNRSIRVLGVTDLDDPRVMTLMKGRGCM